MIWIIDKVHLGLAKLAQYLLYVLCTCVTLNLFAFNFLLGGGLLGDLLLGRGLLLGHVRSIQTKDRGNLTKIFVKFQPTRSRGRVANWPEHRKQETGFPRCGSGFLSRFVVISRRSAAILTPRRDQASPSRPRGRSHGTSRIVGERAYRAECGTGPPTDRESRLARCLRPFPDHGAPRHRAPR